MAQLNNQYVSSSFQGLLKMTDSTQGLTNTLQTIQTGDGDNSPLQMSLTQVNISGSFLVNGQPVSIDTGSFATTGSNSFYGYQNIYVAPGQDTVSVLVQSGSMGEHQIGLTVQPNGSTGLSFANKGNNFFQTNGNLIINSTIGGDGTGSISINVSSGSFNVTSPKVKINDGNITTTGSLIVSGSNNKLIGDINSTSTVNTIIGRTIIQGGAGGGSGATPRLIISGSDGGATTIGRSFVSIDTTKTTGTPTAFGAGLNAYGAPETEGGINIGVYTPDIYTDDYELNIKVTTGGTQFQDFDNFNAFNYEDFLVIPPNVGDSPSPQFKRSVGITGSIDITGQYLVNGVPVSGDRNGLITTGSITDTQQITGSLILGNTILSGSLIGGVVNGGLIKIQTEANRSGSLQFNITGSNPISQSNFVFGSAGPASVFNTGSVIISGSNNIIFNGFRQNTLNQGTFGYIQGNNNIISSIPLITTSSFLNSNYFVSNNNYLNGVVLFDAVASGSITDLSFYFNQMTNNNIGSAQTFRHKSGSLSFTNNNIQGTINSFATQSFLYPSGGVSGPTMNGNVHAGSATVLSHISSSIIYSSNISNSGNLLIRNSATHPAALNGSGSVTLANNIFGGGQQTLTISGSGTQNSKGISQNIVVGLNNELNIIVSGSNAFISNTAILGTSLIVSGSNSSTNGGGSTFVGRYNATGSLQESTNETVFVVGTGTGTGNRRNALRIDSNNNSNFTGSVNISGSAVITGSLTLNGVAVTSSDRNGLITTGSATTYPNQYIQGGLQIVSGSLWAKGRNSLNNIAYGEFALASITTAQSNTGLGNNALSSATTGGGNLAVGGAALSNMTTATNNVGIGNHIVLVVYFV